MEKGYQQLPVEDGELTTTLSGLTALLAKEEANLEHLKKRIAVIRSAIRVLTPADNTGNGDQRLHIEQTRDTRAGTRRSARTGSLAHYVRVKTAEILREKRRPLTRREIYEALEAKGFEFTISDPMKRLSKILWDAQEFHNVGDGYWFSDTTEALQARDE